MAAREIMATDVNESEIEGVGLNKREIKLDVLQVGRRVAVPGCMDGPEDTVLRPGGSIRQSPALLLLLCRFPLAHLTGPSLRPD